MTLTAEQVDYLSTQKLGRLVTVRPDGTPQNNPVGFRYNAELDTIEIAGWNMATSKKFRDLTINAHVAFVVDDIASVEPWRVRRLEIRGPLKPFPKPTPTYPTPDAIIRIYPALAGGRVSDWPPTAGQRR